MFLHMLYWCSVTAWRRSRLIETCRTCDKMYVRMYFYDYCLCWFYCVNCVLMAVQDGVLCSGGSRLCSAVPHWALSQGQTPYTVPSTVVSRCYYTGREVALLAPAMGRDLNGWANLPLGCWFVWDRRLFGRSGRQHWPAHKERTEGKRTDNTEKGDEGRFVWTRFHILWAPPP